MILVADSSALIALSLCNALEFLDVLFEEVKVPLAVKEKGLIEQIKPYVEIIKESDIHISEELIDYVLELAGEG